MVRRHSVDLSKYTSNIPETLYHGTTWQSFQKIRKQGLLLGSRERVNSPDFTHDVLGIISMVDKPKPARFFSLVAASKQHERSGSKKPLRPDMAIISIDTRKAQARGVPMIRAPGQLSRSYGGTEYRAVKDIPPAAVVGVTRIHGTGSAHKEEYYRLDPHYGMVKA